MLRKHENSDSWKAGILAIGVHAVLLVAMLISFNWKAAHTVLNVTEVELWDKIPKSNPPEIKVEPKPIIEEKPEPKPEPKPIVEEKPKPEEPKVDIELEKKKKELEKKEQEQKLKELDELRKKEALDKIKKEAREDELREKKVAENKKRDDTLAKLKEDIRNENGADDAKASSAANASLIGEYTEKIKTKIRNNVNKTLCGDGNPELRFEINLLPTGELSGNPKITKSSGNPTCDEAVERAIIASSTASSPLPLPADPNLKSQFRNLNLKFRPND
jgi:colicin import membrane protein